MQTDERAVPVLGEAEPLVLPAVVTGDRSGDGMPARPRFFGRRAWYRRRVAWLEEQVVIDDLTGLRNLRALWRELNDRTPRCSKASPLTVVMLDFDLFTEVNDRHGYVVGDAVLARAAAVLRDAAAAPELAYRYGGEEFVVLVSGDEAEGSELAERVRAAIAQENSSLPATTISCGVAELDSPVEPWVAIDRADAALREAKRGGRNRVVVAGSSARTASAYLVDEGEHETARRAALAVAVATLEVRDRRTADHADDVLTLCESLGRELGFHGRELERLVAGAQLHDVGKVAVPSEILNKAGPLDDHEWAVIREHTVIGERILRSVPEMAEVATIVRHSHEHWDGGGYPDGLAGEQIPLASRVILCADAFHAIRSDRPYRAGRPAADALTEVRACAGTQFDPVVVDALERVAERVRSRGVGAMALPRDKRLVVLLSALALAGTAVAASPDLRDALRSIFGATTAEPPRLSYDGFSHVFGDGPPVGRSSAAGGDVGAGGAGGESFAALGRTELASPQARRARRARLRLERLRVERLRRAARLSPASRRRRQAVGQARLPIPLTPTGDAPAGTEKRAGSPGTGTGTETRAGSPGTGTSPESPGTTDALAPPSAYCRAESKEVRKGQDRSDFGACVDAQSVLRSGQTDSPGEACKGADTKHVKGEKQTAFSRCVAAATAFRKDQRARSR